MTEMTENQSVTPPAWTSRAELVDVYLDGLRYDRGSAPVPEEGPGMLTVRLHATDESAPGSPHLHLHLELILHGLPADADPNSGAGEDETVFKASLAYRADYQLAGEEHLPPAEERRQFINHTAIPGIWLQLRQMADIVTSQTLAGRVLLPTTPPPVVENPS